MEEKNISPQESIAIIQSMISKSRIKASENGFHLIVWAIMISFASVLQYLMIVYKYHLDKSWWMWTAFTLIAFVIGGVYGYRRREKDKIEKNNINKIVDYIWMAFGISTLLICTFIWRYHIMDITALIHISLGAATFSSGIALAYKPLIRGGIVFWLACVACIIISSPVNLLINAAAMLIGFLLPGILLWKKYKKENNV